MGILVTSTTIRCKALATKRSDSSPADGPPQAKDDKAIIKKFMRVFRDLHLFRLGVAFGCGSYEAPSRRARADYKLTIIFLAGAHASVSLRERGASRPDELALAP